jgi:hypothetical protein
LFRRFSGGSLAFAFPVPAQGACKIGVLEVLPDPRSRSG